MLSIFIAKPWCREDQFKKLFKRQKSGPDSARWSKNIKANEWKAIDRMVDSRTQEGKDSILVVNGRHYDDETLQRDRKRARKGGKSGQASGKRTSGPLLLL